MTETLFSSRTAPLPRKSPWKESLAAVLILLAAWAYGFLTTHSPVAPLVANVLPGATTVTADGDLFIAHDSAGKLVGYAAAADATGYGGPIYLLVGVDPQGQIVGVQVIEQRETPGFYALLRDHRFIQQFLGQTPDQPFVVGQNVDSVSGASLSANAVAQAIGRSVQKIQTGTLQNAPTPLRFGLPEITILTLMFGSLALPRFKEPRLKKALRWALLLVSMVVLGFALNEPLTIANVASLLVGYWPAWQQHLYWYLLVGGVLGYALFAGKNLYCFAICPFGAVQECFGALGAVRTYLPPAVYNKAKWVPRWLGVFALALGLAFRQPGAASFEPFGTLFSFSAGFFPWMLLVLVLFASMIILRPFCFYLCPVGAVISFFLYLNRQAKHLWKTKITVRPARLTNEP
jgi:uncharacterized protein with FMN-binding domain